MPIKTFRGLIVDGGQDTVALHTNDGSIGYRITKFDILRTKPTASTDHVVKIYKVPQATVPTGSATVDLSDNTLLAVAVLSGVGFGEYDTTIVFDNEIFNQDVYVTHTDNDGTEACNYYIELEQMSLDLNQNTVATLKDIRNLA